MAHIKQEIVTFKHPYQLTLLHPNQKVMFIR